MTKQELMQKWGDLSRPLKNDIDAVIAHEIAKMQEKPQPELNPIVEAYERGEKIRKKTWEKDAWIQKHTEIMAIHDDACLRKKVWYNFDTYPNLWELYTEPTEQVAEPAKQFDRDRCERLFCAVVASGHNDDFDADLNDAKYLLEKLNSYYCLINKKNSL